MKTLVVYDSLYGNTEKIAEAIAEGITSTDDVKYRRTNEIGIKDLESIDLLIVGAPTQAGRASKPLQAFLNRIPQDGLNNINVAAFDTRFSIEGRRWLMRTFLEMLGYAAGRIAKGLQGKGGQLVAPPEGFIVKDKEGPLKEGELERAAAWAKNVAESMG